MLLIRQAMGGNALAVCSGMSLGTRTRGSSRGANCRSGSRRLPR